MLIFRFLEYACVQFTYHRVYNWNNTTGNKCGAGTTYSYGAPQFNPVISKVRVLPALVLYICFEGRCLSFCSFFLPLRCLSFLELRLLIVPLVSLIIYYSNGR